jgi:hypothetical protein
VASTSTVQEVHQVLVHVLCGAVDAALNASDAHAWLANTVSAGVSR